MLRQNVFFWLCCIFLLPINVSHSQWIENGIPIRNSFDREELLELIPDNEGNVFVIWAGYEDLWTHYITKIDTGGNRLWSTDSVKFSLYPSQQRSRHAIPDGEGGFVVVWRDTRNDPSAADIYAQRMSKDGERLWGDDGVAVLRQEDYQDEPKLCRLSDGSYIVTWIDERSGFNKFQIFGQRLNYFGNQMWDSLGVPLTFRPSSMFLLGDQKILMSDSANFIMVWDQSKWSESYNNLFTQKYDENGEKLWDSVGVAITSLPYEQGSFGHYDICSDGSQGVVIVWEDERIRNHNDLYVQRVDSSGSCVWQENGIQQPNSNGIPNIHYDGDSTFIYVWGVGKIYAQKITRNGQFLFPKEGLLIGDQNFSGGGGQEIYPLSIKTDDGIIVAWQNQTNGGENGDLFAQKIDFNGNKLWGQKDISVTSDPYYQGYHRICADGYGGAYVGWTDERDFWDNDWDAYLQRVYPDGSPGGLTDIGNFAKNSMSIQTPVLYQNYPNPFNLHTVLSFYLPKPEITDLIVFDLNGKRIKTLIDNKLMKGGDNRVIWDGCNDTGGKVSSGFYFYRLRTADQQLTKKMLIVK